MISSSQRHRSDMTLRAGFALLLLSTTLGGATSAIAAASEARLAYTLSLDQAARDFAAARTRCEQGPSTEKSLCRAQADANRVRLEATARAQYHNSQGATTEARTAIARASHALEQARCQTLPLPRQTDCLAQANSSLVLALAGPATGPAIVQARTETAEDLRSAAYQQAMTRCDAYTGDPRQACVARVKTHFGK